MDYPLSMQIAFFEEFPTEENLAKLNYIRWPTKLYLAAPSLLEFRRLCATIKNQTISELVYWPVLLKKEGYWISPFSSGKALRRILAELEHQTVSVMLDLELPTTQNPFLYITQSWSFWCHKKMIGDFIKHYSGKIYLAEYFTKNAKQTRLLEKVGLHFTEPHIHYIKMLYHSLHQFSQEFLLDELLLGNMEYGARFVAGYGTISPGIHGTEPILSQKQLEQDLQLAKDAGISEVVIYRLGGLGKEYAKVIKKFNSI